MLPYESMPLKSWPFFPLCFSGNSFFAMSEGRLLAGYAEPPTSYIRFCQSKGQFRKKLLFVPTREQALVDAARVRELSDWKNIPLKEEWWHEWGEKRTWEFIRHQAKAIPKRPAILRV